jgi:DinB superfamily
MLWAMPVFEDVLVAYAGLSDQRLSEPWRWPGHDGGPLEVRDALLRSLELEVAALAGTGMAASEAVRALALAQAAFGDLRGLLCGQPDALLDTEPGDGEWTLRQVLQHVLWVERRYQLQVAYASTRSDDDPIRREHEVPVEDAESVATWMRRLAETRQEGRRLLAVPDGTLTRPTGWAGYAVDVRFRLHRFTGHLAQHTVQCEKVLARLGRTDGEARMLVRRISAARGAHEWLSETALLARLDAEHHALASSLT